MTFNHIWVKSSAQKNFLIATKILSKKHIDIHSKFAVHIIIGGTKVSNRLT